MLFFESRFIRLAYFRLNISSIQTDERGIMNKKKMGELTIQQYCAYYFHYGSNDLIKHQLAERLDLSVGEFDEIQEKLRKYSEAGERKVTGFTSYLTKLHEAFRRVSRVYP